MNKILTTAAVAVSLGLASQANAAVTVYKDDNSSVSIGGYVKLDARHQDGDLAFRRYFIGNNPGAVDTSETRLYANESRLQFKVQHDDVTGVIELDFYTAEGNEVISNSHGARIRHAFIKYKNWTVGQTWSTFMPLHALSETLDFGGPHVGEVFIRQAQIRYTSGGWSFAVENPQTFGGGNSGSAQESMVDLIGRYDFKGDWGQASVSGLVRKVDQSGVDETAAAINAAAKIKIGDKDDIRFQVSVGEYGRYAGTTAVPDVAVDADGEVQVEDGTSYTLSYRHFWNETTRSTIYIGGSDADVSGQDRQHWGANVITNLTPKLKTGIEVGRYTVSDNLPTDLSSNYVQLSAVFAF
ncbi:MAG: DcaP family trimeric outer membrane transporter [Glaciecola sp.]